MTALGGGRSAKGRAGLQLIGSDQVHDGVDQRQMGECLGKVAQVTAALRVDLLAV